jgi:hypothetical protein
MKKLLMVSALFIALASCNSSSSNESASGSSESTTSGDTTNKQGLTNPSAIDTTKHPDGMINSEAITTDTAAMNTQNSVNKAKAAQKSKK